VEDIILTGFFGDFLEAPLSINQSSLSKHLRLLVEKNLITKEEGKYVITRAGKSEYSRMLQNYDLDRQTILEEEGKRLKRSLIKQLNFSVPSELKIKTFNLDFLTIF